MEKGKVYRKHPIFESALVLTVQSEKIQGWDEWCCTEILFREFRHKMEVSNVFLNGEILK